MEDLTQPLFAPDAVDLALGDSGLEIARQGLSFVPVDEVERGVASAFTRGHLPA